MGNAPTVEDIMSNAYLCGKAHVVGVLCEECLQMPIVCASNASVECNHKGLPGCDPCMHASGWKECSSHVGAWFLPSSENAVCPYCHISHEGDVFSENANIDNNLPLAKATRFVGDRPGEILTDRPIVKPPVAERTAMTDETVVISLRNLRARAFALPQSFWRDLAFSSLMSFEQAIREGEQVRVVDVSLEDFGFRVREDDCHA
jgi:hypothetical protein